jgi:hypothetical protein
MGKFDSYNISKFKKTGKEEQTGRKRSAYITFLSRF